MKTLRKSSVLLLFLAVGGAFSLQAMEHDKKQTFEETSLTDTNNSSKRAKKQLSTLSLEEKRDLIESIRFGKIKTIQKLIDEGYDFNVRMKDLDYDFDGKTIDDSITFLHMAVNFSAVEIIKLFIRVGVDPNAKDSQGKTALMELISDEDSQLVELVELFIQAGVDPNAKDNQGKTVLMRAVLDRAVEIIKLFIRAGVDPNAKDNEGFTALYYAKEYPEIFRVLVKNGADITAKNLKNQDMLHCVCEKYLFRMKNKKYLDVIATLLEYIARINNPEPF